MKVATSTRQCSSNAQRVLQMSTPSARVSLHQPRRHGAAPGTAYLAPAPRVSAPVLFAGHAPALAKVSDAIAQTGNARAIPVVLHIDADATAASVMISLLEPEARVVHAPTLAEARRLLQTEIFTLVVLDPLLPDGDGVSLLSALERTPLLVYSARHPAWRSVAAAFLPKPWTSPRQLWSTISGLLGIAPHAARGD